MKTPLNILHLEDNNMDATMVEALLIAEGIPCKIRQVYDRQEFHAGLTNENLDLVLSDFSMPGFDGLSALDLSRSQRPDVPFIFLSGTLGEELAVQALLKGATDYVLKDRMIRLPVAIRRATSEREMAQKRKESENSLRESEERFRLMMASVDYAIWVCDLSGTITYWNQTAAAIYGWTAGEVFDRHAGALLFRKQEKLLEEALRQTLSTGKWSAELTRVNRHDQTLVIQSRWSLMLNSNGQPQSVLVVDNDITDKKRLEAEILRNQRVETIGALAGGIAHDLNNALTPVVMGAHMLSAEPLSREGREMLDLMRRSAERGTEMVKQILSFSRGVGGHEAFIAISSIIEEISRFTQKTFPASIEITTKVASDLHQIKGNATQLHQVLLNLCVNARDAMPDGGRLTIEASNVTLEHESASGDYVLIAVSDTGQGIAPALLTKIFEPFFTTKEIGRGTGLGLSTVLGIIKTHGGHVDVASQLGNGTTFRVYLPAKPSS